MVFRVKFQGSSVPRIQGSRVGNWSGEFRDKR